MAKATTPDPGNKVPQTIMWPPALRQQVQQRAEEEGRPFSHMVVRLVEQALRQPA